LRPIFNAGQRDAARELVGGALERLGKPLPKVAALLEEAEEDLVAFYAFPTMHKKDNNRKETRELTA
jgi:transposase-like protein